MIAWGLDWRIWRVLVDRGSNAGVQDADDRGTRGRPARAAQLSYPAGDPSFPRETGDRLPDPPIAA